jgi:transcriptional regulator with PAS, ATPase and Fis domain
MVQRKLFREDLFFRLNVYVITLPPLRERPEDILELAAHFIAYFNPKFGKNFRAISPDAQAILLAHRWPGNVRELRNLIERVILSVEGTIIKKEHLRFLSTSAPAPDEPASFQLPQSGIDLVELEKNLMLQALKHAKWNKTRAAKFLKLTPAAFYYRLEKYGLDEHFGKS